MPKEIGVLLLAVMKVQNTFLCFAKVMSLTSATNYIIAHVDYVHLLKEAHTLESWMQCGCGLGGHGFWWVWSVKDYTIDSALATHKGTVSEEVGKISMLITCNSCYRYNLSKSI